jgi:hypothetical protein
MLEYWTVWYPKAAATGLLLGRGLVEPAQQMLVHAAPEVLTVEVSGEAGQRLAYGTDLPRTLESPMCKLWREGERVQREDIWPTAADLGCLVLLPGGEVGVLKQWWHADDLREWRWQIELHNRLR